MRIEIPEGRCFTSKPINCCCPWFQVATWKSSLLGDAGRWLSPSCRWCQERVVDGDRPEACRLRGPVVIEVEAKP